MNRKCVTLLILVIILGLTWVQCHNTPDISNEPDWHLNAPIPYSPVNGAYVHHDPPPLLVYNVASPQDTSLFYDFELYAADQPVAVAASYLVPQTDLLTTRWVPPVILSPGQWYYWRVRATTGDGNQGPWMPVAYFSQFDYRENVPDRYVAYGDSITGGYGSRTYGDNLPGYQEYLYEDLLQFYGAAEIITKWIPGAYYRDGAAEVNTVLEYHPAVVLILFGTHDTISNYVPPSEIMLNLHIIVSTVLQHGSLPVLGTLPPVNPTTIYAPRQQEINILNDNIRAYGSEYNIPVADINRYFWEQAQWDSSRLPLLFSDHEHPNDDGYRIMAMAWFDTIIAKNSSIERVPETF